MSSPKGPDAQATPSNAGPRGAAINAERVSYGSSDPQFTGEALLRLVIDIEAAVGSHAAACTPLGRAVMELAEAAANADPELQASKR